jgi:hypothetical protein
MTKAKGPALVRVTYRSSLKDGREVAMSLVLPPEAATVADAWRRLTAVHGWVDPLALEIEIWELLCTGVTAGPSEACAGPSEARGPTRSAHTSAPASARGNRWSDRTCTAWLPRLRAARKRRRPA